MTIQQDIARYRAMRIDPKVQRRLLSYAQRERHVDRVKRSRSDDDTWSVPHEKWTIRVEMPEPKP